MLLIRCRNHHHGYGKIANGYLDHVVESESWLGNAQIKNLQAGVECFQGGECGNFEPVGRLYRS